MPQAYIEIVLLSKPGTRPLVPGDQLRIEGRPPISWHIQLYASGVGDYRLLTIPVSAVAGLAVRKTMAYPPIQRPFGQRFLQTIQRAVRSRAVLGAKRRL
jgi:hypothetical protein